MRAAQLRGAVDVVVEPMHRRHLRAVVRIERANSAGRGWSPGLFAAELRRGGDDRCYVVARAGGSVAGFAGALYVMPEGHVTTVSVDPRWHGRRIGTRLLAALVHDARARGVTAMTLEVRAGNAPAIGLYRAFGFAPAGVRRNYYAETGEDALVMWASEIGSVGYTERLARIDAALAHGGGVVDGTGDR